LGLFGAGAATMYLLDPNRGRRRRALARDSVIHTEHQLQRFAGKAARDIAHRAEGAVAEAGSFLGTEPLPDYVIEDRVRSAMGHVVSHPGAIDVTSREGVVTLAGWVLAREAEPLLRLVANVRGVKGVESNLGVTEHPEHISDLQGGVPRTGRRFELLQEQWSPAARVLMGVLGAGLLGYGVGRRGLPALALAPVGGAILARSVWNRELRQLLGATGPGIRLQKTIYIDAPAAELYQFWVNPENYPQVFSHVNEVARLSDGLYHWKVGAPAGISIAWEGSITRMIPDKLVEWGSLPGSMVDNSGVVRLDKQDGGTRVHIQMSYNPPTGIVGHYLAELLGVDPKRALDDDLVRLKSLFEEGKTSAHGHKVVRSDIQPPARAAEPPSHTGTEG
jgi:uncharacterized membrane protein